MIINLTPNPIRVFGNSAPDIVDIIEQTNYIVIPTQNKYHVANLKELELGTYDMDGISIENIQYGLMSYTPPQVAGTYYIVPLVTALACKRNDFLVPYKLVRDSVGTVVGCRKLARPI